VTYPIDAPLQARQAEAVLLTLIEQGRRILKDPKSYEARANFMWAATAALNGLIEAGTTSDWTTHKIGHELTALYGLDHAETLAVVLPAVFKVLRVQKYDKLMQYGRNVWGLNHLGGDALADAAIQATEDFFVEVGVKVRLSDYGIASDNFSRIADKIEANGALPLSERKNVGKAEIVKILEACY
jgi:NADP-dependent alcohol dehydrogenase